MLVEIIWKFQVLRVAVNGYFSFNIPLKNLMVFLNNKKIDVRQELVLIRLDINAIISTSTKLSLLKRVRI